jgi:hypothetical protein
LKSKAFLAIIPSGFFPIISILEAEYFPKFKIRWGARVAGEKEARLSNLRLVPGLSSFALSS